MGPSQVTTSHLKVMSYLCTYIIFLQATPLNFYYPSFLYKNVVSDGGPIFAGALFVNLEFPSICSMLYIHICYIYTIIYRIFKNIILT